MRTGPFQHLGLEVIAPLLDKKEVQSLIPQTDNDR
jgi:hypothetical protein